MRQLNLPPSAAKNCSFVRLLYSDTCRKPYAGYSAFAVVGVLRVGCTSHCRHPIMCRRKAWADESERLLTENGNYRYRPIGEVDDWLLSGSSIARRVYQVEAGGDEKFKLELVVIPQLIVLPEPKKKRRIGFTARIEKLPQPLQSRQQKRRRPWQRAWWISLPKK
jgi:hypothetical protein